MRKNLKLLGIADTPIHKAIKKVLPRFAKNKLADPKTRRQIVYLADKALITSEPAAAAIPAGVRRRMIAATLSILLGPARV